MFNIISFFVVETIFLKSGKDWAIATVDHADGFLFFRTEAEKTVTEGKR